MAKRSKTLASDSKGILTALGKKIVKIREERNESVYDLTGDDMPIKSRQHWQSIENGKKNINFTTLQKIAQTLNVSLSELVQGLD